LEQLPLLHGDPFDRLIVATSIADTYRLVTHDRTLAAYGDHVLLV
jgi:PIN domain nuclease of toxin-antitoxin system